MRLFDVYIAVDWSSRTVKTPAKPSPDAIWVGEQISEPVKGEAKSSETYLRTRLDCFNYLKERLVHHKDLNRKVLIGFDFAYGYPSGYAKALGLNGTQRKPWQYIWDELTRLITDDENNTNNRFEVASELNKRSSGEVPGPLWGIPNGRTLPHLTLTSPQYPCPTKSGISIEKWRWVDKRERGIQPIWKLIGTGSVGGQCLVGIPVVNKLRYHFELENISRVWPFETGFTKNPIPNKGPYILHVEIWPGLVPAPLEGGIEIKDQAQVRATAKWFRELDESGKLSLLFDKPLGLNEDAIEQCINEEGWILGNGFTVTGERKHVQTPILNIRSSA